MTVIHQILASRICRNVSVYREYATYSKTLNLPKTKFPLYVKDKVRADHDKAIREKYLKPLYQWQRKHLTGKEFVLHDGPPYANGDLHMGHAINKLSKDFVLRNQIMKGNRVHYKPGWDCHGLPIELKAKQIQADMDSLEIRDRASKFAAETVEIQKSEFESWGITADWTADNTYRTFDTKYVQNQLNMFHSLYSKGLIIRDFKPVYWSTSTKTALAEAELEYDPNHVSPSLYMRFRLAKMPESLRKFENVGDLYALIWTTTPWTLPSNQAICFNSKLSYSLVRLNEGHELYIVATDLIPSLREKLTGYEVDDIATINAMDLEQCSYFHPIDAECELPFLPGKHVKSTAGTGLVHTAPAHGFDDYLVALEKKIQVKSIVNQFGVYSDETPEFLRGKDVSDGNQLCLNHVKSHTIHLDKITHSCPIDWRTKQPVIINASYQWFLNIAEVRDLALEQLEQVDVINSSGQNVNQLKLLLQKRPYWCISRQRVWGVPIPAFYRKDNNETITSNRIISHLTELLMKNGSIDFWWKLDAKDLLPADELQRLGGDVDNIVKGNDILDIWFDSGVSWSHVLNEPKVADLYLEGVDQCTGWFQSSLITSVAARGIAPYRSIFVHGFAVDEHGKKMSKSIGNVTIPADIIKKHNIDTLRWWVAKHGGNMVISVKPDHFDESAEDIQTIRKILRYFIGYADQMLKSHDIHVNPERLTPLDIYSLNELFEFDRRAQKMSTEYRFQMCIATILNYTISHLSAFYLDKTKDRLYLNAKCENVEVFKVLSAHFHTLCKHLWPIAPHLVEEVWSYFDSSQPFYNSKFHVPDTYENAEFNEVMTIADKLFGIFKTKSKGVTWNFRVKIWCDEKTMNQLHKLHPNDGQDHNNSHLCEIIQAQSVQLFISSDNTCELEAEEIEQTLCERCRRFAVPTPATLCKRCESVLADSNTSQEHLFLKQ